jgi:tetratricopeptide (TPR) repeat protein
VSRFAFFFCLLIPCLALARNDLRASVEAEPGTDFTMLHFVVLDANQRTELCKGALRRDGSFRCADLPLTVVEIQVLSPHGDAMARHFAALPSPERLRMRLPGNGVGGGVSVYRLKYRPGKDAQQHWDRAAAALKRHDPHAAAPELDQAIQSAPDFADAHEHRGLIALADGQYDLAAQHLMRAAEIDPGDPQFLSNASLGCLAAARNREAEEYARALLRLEPGSDRGYFLLGASLTRQDRNRQEALAALERAQRSFPDARQFLLQLREP